MPIDIQSRIRNGAVLSIETSVAVKKALIAGITGQDGSYLAELLLSKRYEVHSIIRRASTFNTERIDGDLDSAWEDLSRDKIGRVMNSGRSQSEKFQLWS